MCVEEQLCPIQNRGGGQQEEKRRGSRWRGQGGGGDVCQEGWLGSTLQGTDGIKGLSGMRSFFFSLCLLIFHFCTSAVTMSCFFSLSSPSSCPCSYYNLLCIVLYLCSTHSFHFCPCVFERPLTLPSLHGK